MTDSAQQLADLISELERHEAELRFHTFSNDDAWRLGVSLVEIGRSRRLPITVDIRRGGQQLFHAALEGTTPENDSWIERKVRVVARFAASSYLVGRRLAAKGDVLDAAGYGVDPALFATHGGSFPVRVRNVGVVGSVTVSGLAQSEDHALVVEAIGQFLDR